MAAPLKQIYEIYPSAPQALLPLGVRVNDMVYAESLNAADPVTGAVSGDIKEQTSAALGKLRDLMTRAGGSLDNVGRAVGFCTTAEHRNAVDEVWMTVFPDINDKPAFKVLLAELPPGHLVRIDALALLGERRTRFDIPNVTAHDPTVRIGNWVFSSRCHGNEHATGKIVEGGVAAEAKQTLENLATLIKSAGGSEANIRQITTFGRDASYLEPARLAFEARFPDPATCPVLNQVINFVSPAMQVAMEMAAVL